jgi:hypothetical protein
MKKKSEINIVKCCNDIQKMKIENTDSIDDIFKKFYDIMINHGVCQWEESLDENGEVHPTGHTMEWILCKSTLLKKVEIEFTTYDLFGGVPEPIQCFKLKE